jgi:hypothetical protein
MFKVTEMYMSKPILYLVLICFSLKLSAALDPFQRQKSKKLKLPMTKKYQYLGYIKGPKLHRGFVRPAGGEVEGLNFGRNPGFGEVVVLNKQQICILKQKQQWCLDKSAQTKLWHMGMR